MPHVNIPHYESDSDQLSGRESEDQDEIRSNDENADRSQTGREGDIHESEIHYEDNVGGNQTGEETGSNPEERCLGGNAIERDRGSGTEQLQYCKNGSRARQEKTKIRQTVQESVNPKLCIPT